MNTALLCPWYKEEKYSFYRDETSPISLLYYFLVGREHVHLVREYLIKERSALNKSDHEPVLMNVDVAGAFHDKSTGV